jgi:hypothetical protein
MASQPEHPSSRPEADLKDSIWTFYQNGCGLESRGIEWLLSDFLSAGRFDLAMELLKFQELERIADNVESIKEAIEGVDANLTDISAAVSNMQP